MSTNSSLVLSDSTYRIESEIGAGGGGVVYKAWHTRLQKHVVIKELKRGSEQDLETQRNEVEALKNVKSIYLPQVLDFLSEDGRIFTVMEFVEGESLDKLLARGVKFSQAQVVKWYGQLASALEVIHKQNICHRDIKPANIMLTPSGDVCLIDFNAALVNGNDVQLISRSLGYASPEQYEIYERFKNSRQAPINYDDSSVSRRPSGDCEATELLDEEKTELLDHDNDLNEPCLPDEGAQRTEIVTPRMTDGVDWKRSDIYSLGATMYHLLSGVHPPQRAAEMKPLDKVGHFSEGIVNIIDMSTRINPGERFAGAEQLRIAIRDIHKMDTRWKAQQAKKLTAMIIFPMLFLVFAVMALFGRRVMAQEKEERFYTAVYDIGSGTDPQSSYETALGIYWDRIEPYRAMAERLWNDGDPAVCKDYIESNLGNIAQFQTIPEAQRSFGDIYYILGNCYYYQAGEPNYHLAEGNFAIAVQYVKDNPIYYRDYAIALARTGAIDDAERILERAQVLQLDTDSLNLLKGEIDFSKQEYGSSSDYFQQVIQVTTDDDMRYRACHTLDEIFKLQGQPERSVEVLSAAMNQIPLNRVPEMTERLADAYVKCGDYEKAITLYDELIADGVPQFHIMQNLAILLENINEFDRAAAVLSEMADAFPGDYRVPMRQAFLEADRQSTIRNENRDYALTKEYFEAAIALYRDNLKPGEADPEMEQLEYLIEQLKANKWIQ